jgi:polyisoprenoid-binding protein YceI
MPWQLDPAHSSIDFAVRHMVISSVKGRFQQFDIAAEVDESNLAGSSATVTIDAASIDTREAQRDGHLRSGDFLDAESHPAITFVTKTFEPRGGADYRIVGDLTIRGVTREVALQGEVTGPVKDPWGNLRVGLSAEGKFDRKEFGLNWNALLEAGGVLVGDTVKISIDAELVKSA